MSTLIVKKCQSCGRAMYVQLNGNEEPTMVGCEACIIDIRLERKSDTEIVIKGKCSTQAVRCSNCKKKHLLRSFEEVKDGVASPQKESGKRNR